MSDQVADEERPAEAVTSVPRQTRRLTDKILLAFHQACDQRDLEVADELLRVLEIIVSRRNVHPGQNRRKSIESLVAAHERLWYLRHPD